MELKAPWTGLALVNMETFLLDPRIVEALANALPGATPEEIQDAVNDYLTANPPSVGSQFVQSTPQGSWVISHNLGRLPSVTVYVGGEEVEADVTASNTQVTVTFATPVAGTAILI